MPTAKKRASKKKPAKKASSKKTAKKTTKKATVKKSAKKSTTKKSTAKKTGKKTAKKTTKKTAKKKVAKKTSKTAAKPAKKKVGTKSANKTTVTKKAKQMAKPESNKKPEISTPPVEPNVSTETMLIKGFKPYQLERQEDYMNAEQVEHFRFLLRAWKKELLEEVERTVHHMRDEAANFPDPNDRATQESEFSLELRARDRERKLIKKIDEALANLDSGDYGYCESCGVEIGIRRLEARPTATLCIGCKELDEIRERQFG